MNEAPIGRDDPLANLKQKFGIEGRSKSCRKNLKFDPVQDALNCSDLLYLLFKKLDGVTFCKASRVCKRWRSLTKWIETYGAFGFWRSSCEDEIPCTTLEEITSKYPCNRHKQDYWKSVYQLSFKLKGPFTLKSEKIVKCLLANSIYYSSTISAEYVIVQEALKSGTVLHFFSTKNGRLLYRTSITDNLLPFLGKIIVFVPKEEKMKADCYLYFIVASTDVGYIDVVRFDRVGWNLERISQLDIGVETFSSVKVYQDEIIIVMTRRQILLYSIKPSEDGEKVLCILTKTILLGEDKMSYEVWNGQLLLATNTSIEMYSLQDGALLDRKELNLAVEILRLHRLGADYLLITEIIGFHDIWIADLSSSDLQFQKCVSSAYKDIMAFCSFGPILAIHKYGKGLSIFLIRSVQDVLTLHEESCVFRDESLKWKNPSQLDFVYDGRHLLLALRTSLIGASSKRMYIYRFSLTT